MRLQLIEDEFENASHRNVTTAFCKLAKLAGGADAAKQAEITSTRSFQMLVGMGIHTTDLHKLLSNKTIVRRGAAPMPKRADVLRRTQITRVATHDQGHCVVQIWSSWGRAGEWDIKKHVAHVHRSYIAKLFSIHILACRAVRCICFASAGIQMATCWQ